MKIEVEDIAEQIDAAIAAVKTVGGIGQVVAAAVAAATGLRTGTARLVSLAVGLNMKKTVAAVVAVAA